MNRSLRSLCSILLGAAVSAGQLLTLDDSSPAQWNQFRGPGGNAVASVRPISPDFLDAKHLKWKTAIPGGQSSPIIWGKPCFLKCIRWDDQGDGDAMH